MADGRGPAESMGPPSDCLQTHLSGLYLPTYYSSSQKTNLIPWKPYEQIFRALNLSDCDMANCLLCNVVNNKFKGYFRFRELPQPAGDDYRLCRDCGFFVSSTNVHCKLCDSCTSKVGNYNFSIWIDILFLRLLLKISHQCNFFSQTLFRVGWSAVRPLCQMLALCEGDVRSLYHVSALSPAQQMSACRHCSGNA